MRPFVEVEDVDFAYGAVTVLERINLTVEPGDFLGIIGPNGSGKTTLLRIMLGLLAPPHGTVRLFGHPPASFRQWVAAALQDPGWRTYVLPPGQSGHDVMVDAPQRLADILEEAA